MSFKSTSFVFDGVSCEQYGLFICEVDDKRSSESIMPETSIVEDNVGSSFVHYGIKYDKRLSGTIVIASMNKLDAYDKSVIAGWLLGHNQYKWLEICQEDMRWVRYKAIIRTMEPIQISSDLYGFSCEIECDSPFAYTYPIVQAETISGSTLVKFINMSSCNEYFYPKFKFTPANGTATLSIKNKSDSNRICSIGGIKNGNVISVDNKKEIITNTLNENLFTSENTNGNFLRCIRGENILEITGNGTLEFTSEFPINIGF